MFRGTYNLKKFLVILGTPSCILFFSVAQQPKSGLGPLIVVVPKSHTIRDAPGWTPLNE